jgi:hypothetical protein
MPKERQLTLSSDFERMRIFQQPISIFQDGILVDEKVIIESHNEELIVCKSGDTYLKSIYTFVRR